MDGFGILTYTGIISETSFSHSIYSLFRASTDRCLSYFLCVKRTDVESPLAKFALGTQIAKSATEYQLLMNKHSV